MRLLYQNCFFFPSLATSFCILRNRISLTSISASLSFTSTALSLGGVALNIFDAFYTSLKFGRLSPAVFASSFAFDLNRPDFGRVSTNSDAPAFAILSTTPFGVFDDPSLICFGGMFGPNLASV